MDSPLGKSMFSQRRSRDLEFSVSKVSFFRSSPQGYPKSFETRYGIESLLLGLAGGDPSNLRIELMASAIDFDIEMAPDIRLTLGSSLGDSNIFYEADKQSDPLVMLFDVSSNMISVEDEESYRKQLSLIHTPDQDRDLLSEFVSPFKGDVVYPHKSGVYHSLQNYLKSRSSTTKRRSRLLGGVSVLPGADFHLHCRSYRSLGRTLKSLDLVRIFWSFLESVRAELDPSREFHLVMECENLGFLEMLMGQFVKGGCSSLEAPQLKYGYSAVGSFLSVLSGIHDREINQSVAVIDINRHGDIDFVFIIPKS